ncbi:MAG: hypothetical protein H0T49_01565 [Chloroflexia bacterium]|jgi:hypothetical protein|nr:hypothetical protein [Chloroflexia bacterium]
MKTALTRITVGLVSVIVVVLAGHLILIAAALIRANRNLAKLVGGLEAIRDNTAPLGDDLTAINGAAIALRDGLTAVDEHLRGIARIVRG